MHFMWPESDAKYTFRICVYQNSMYDTKFALIILVTVAEKSFKS